MYINVFYEDDGLADVITIPDDCNNIEKLQSEFFEWLFDKKNDHEYWVVENGEKLYCNYGTDAFVKWLNQNVFADSANKSKVYKCICNDYNPKDVAIYF